MVPGPCHGETGLTHSLQPRWKMYCEAMSHGSTSGVYMFTSMRLAVFAASFAGCSLFDPPTDCQPASSSAWSMLIFEEVAAADVDEDSCPVLAELRLYDELASSAWLSFSSSVTGLFVEDRCPLGPLERDAARAFPRSSGASSSASSNSSTCSSASSSLFSTSSSSSLASPSSDALSAESTVQHNILVIFAKKHIK